MGQILKKIVCLFFLLIMGQVSYAQDSSRQEVTAFDNRLNFGEETIVDIDGNPIFLIGETVVPAAEKKSEAFIPTPVNWKEENQKVSIKTSFGEKLSVPFIEHIPYFFITIQLLSNGQALVTENIQLIVTPEGPHNIFSRIYDTKVITPQGIYWPVHRNIIKVSHNYRSLDFAIRQDEGNDRMILTFPEIRALDPGLHIFEISYLVPEALISGENVDLLFLNLLGRSLPYPIERMGLLVSIPASTKVVGKKLLFGENNIAVENTVEIGEDENGHIAMKVTRLLPPLTDVRLDIMMEKTPEIELPIFSKIGDFLFNNFLFTIIGIITFLILSYYLIEAKFRGTENMRKKTRMKVAQKLSYSADLLRYVLYRVSDARTAASILLSMAEKGIVILDVQSDEKLSITKGNQKRGLTLSQKYILNRLFSKASNQAYWDSYHFQNDKKLWRIIQVEYFFEYFKVASQELFGGWVLAGIFLFLISLTKITPNDVLFISIFLASSVIVGTGIFISKGPYQALIRETYENKEKYLKGILKDSIDQQRKTIENNVSILVAIDGIRRNVGNDLKIKFPLLFQGKEGKEISLTFIDKIVLNKNHH